MLMRVAIGIHGEDIGAAIETYNMMSEKLFTHASPTLFNAATPRPQLSRYLLSSTGISAIQAVFNVAIFLWTMTLYKSIVEFSAP